MDKKRYILDNTLFIIPLLTFSRSVLIASGLTTLPPYRGERSFILRAIRELHYRMKLPFYSIWYYPIDREYETFFIFDGISPNYVEWLHKTFPQSKIILFYNNKCEPYDSPDRYPYEFLTMWSGDVNDCHKWKVLNQTPVVGAYAKSWLFKKQQPEYDVFFIGQDKGFKRMKVLKDLEKLFLSMGLNPFFYVTAAHRYDRYRNKGYKKPIPYGKSLEYLSKSKSILYLGYGSQECVTIRVQESLIHKIKLITDCTWIKKYDFYNPNNIFILGEDDVENLPKFLNSPYEEVESDFFNHIYFEDLAYDIIKSSYSDRF